MTTPTTPTKAVADVPEVTPKPTIQDLAGKDTDENSSAPHAQPPMFPPFTQLSDDTDESYVEVPNEDETPKLTPKQDNTSVRNMDESVTTLATTDNLSLPKDSVWSTDDEATGFRPVHYKLFETVTAWMQQDDASRSPFHLKWQRAIYEGLTGLSKWERLAKIFKLAYLRDYVTLMYKVQEFENSMN